MSLKEGSGPSKTEFGGRSFGKSKGSSNYLGAKAPKIASLPSGGGSKKGQSFYLGQGAGYGVPKKASPTGKGVTSHKAAAQDAADGE